MPKKNTSSYIKLRDKWIGRHKSIQRKFILKHKDIIDWINKNPKQLAIGSLGSLMLLAAPSVPLLPASASDSALIASVEALKNIDKKYFLVDKLKQQLPDNVRTLEGGEEEKIGELLSESYGFSVTAELSGKRLNRSYGLIGAEQHLYRYPGDNLSRHADSPDDWEKFGKSGIAPGLGAFGYFAPSQAQFSERDKMREKYYLAVQTFLVPDYNERVAEYRDFFAFRKMLVVNPENGKAVVAVIGDAGPAAWTGKHLGGSPETMYHLERKDGKQRGPVLYFFIDDPDDTIALGPIEPKQ